MSSKEIIERLNQNGWTLVRVKGSHHQFKHQSNNNVVTVKHPEKDTPKGTLANISRKSGLKF
jgi:predicted RNA binding protein YcfA (HicA-like mRNA interferase family)